MREYHLYKIREDIASEFYSRESKIFQLFLEERKTTGLLKEIFQRQTRYITSDIQTAELKDYLWAVLMKSNRLKMEGEAIILDCEKSSISFLITQRYAILNSYGNFEAETVLFEALRKFDRCFLAMDFYDKKYGWLTPVKLSSLYGT